MANEKRLTEQDKFAYYAIAGFIKDHGYPPSVRDLCRMTGKKSSATIQYRLKSLEQKGYIKITHGESRSIRILKGIEGIPTVEVCMVGGYHPGADLIAVLNAERSMLTDT